MAQTIDEIAREIKAVAMHDLVRADGDAPNIRAILETALLTVAREQREKAFDEAIAIMKDYERQCSETAVEFSENETKTGQTIYWRADGASDALEIVWQKLEQIRAADGAAGRGADGKDNS